MKKRLYLVLACLSALVPASAVTVTPATDGIQVVGEGDSLSFKIAFPVLISGDQKVIYKNKQAEVKDNTVTLTYEGGGQLLISLDTTGKVEMTGVNLPDDVKFMRLVMPIGIEFKNGGHYQAAKAAAQAFPEEKPAKAHLFQGHAETLTLRLGDGKGIVITAPPYSYHDLADNRAWGAESFQWMGLANYNATNPKVVYQFTDAPAAATP